MADAVEAARARIDRALNDLEARVQALKARPAPLPDDDLFTGPGANGADPETAARVAELEAAAQDAAQALTRAADEMRGLLDGDA